MLQFFRNNQLVTIPLVVGYFLIFYMALWMRPQPETISHVGWSTSMLGLARLLADSIVAHKLFWAANVLAQAFLVNFLVNHYKLAKRYSFIGAVALVLVYAFVPFDLAALPWLLGNTFMLLALYGLLACYDKKGTGAALFNMGFWCSLAALCDWSFSIFALLLLLGWLMQRAFDWRELLLWLLGLLLPLFWMWLYQYLSGGVALWWSADIAAKYGLTSFAFGAGWRPYLVLGFWALLQIWFLLAMGQLQQKTTLQEQKHISIVYLMLLNAALGLFLLPQTHLWHLLLAAVPVSILLGLRLQAILSNAKAELSHWFLFMVALAVQYQFLFG